MGSFIVIFYNNQVSETTFFISSKRDLLCVTIVSVINLSFFLITPFIKSPDVIPVAQKILSLLTISLISYFLFNNKPSSSASDLTKILAAPLDGRYEGLKYMGCYKCKFRADKGMMKSCSKNYGLILLKELCFSEIPNLESE